MAGHVVPKGVQDAQGRLGIRLQIQLAAQAIPIIIGIRVVGCKQCPLIRQRKQRHNRIEDTQARIQEADAAPLCKEVREHLELVPLGQLIELPIIRGGIDKGMGFKYPDKRIGL